MDVEQLKMILETASTAGEGVKTIAYFYLAKETLISLCGVGLIGLAIWLGYKTVLLFFKWSQDAQTLKRISELLGVSCYPPFTHAERERILDAVKKRIKDE